MQGILPLLSYPEFWFAGLVSLIWFGLNSNGVDGLHAPAALSQIATVLVKAMPDNYVAWITRMQNWAGWRSNAAFGDFCSIKLVLPLISLLTAIVFPLYVSFILAVALFFAADGALSFSAKQRQQRLREALPQALDLMVLCVDAGLGLDATLQRIASDRATVDHVLNEELSNLGRDILLGMERQRAYQELFNRTGVEELKMLGSALNQTTKMGLSLAKILRAQCDFLRTRQHQQAEEKAAKMPVWMAFPLWFCVMPALMLVIIGPSIITFAKHFSPGLFQ